MLIRALLGALLACATARAMPPDFRLGDGEAGPSCAHLLNMGPLPWRNKGGDWRDALGKLQGDEPYSRTVLAHAPGRTMVDVDLTRLARRWLAAPAQNQGVLLRLVDAQAGSVIDFHSRESADTAARPQLKLRWRDGRTARLAPRADTYLDCSALRSLGQQPLLKLGGGRSVWLAFDLPTHAAELDSATLWLTTDQQYGRLPVTIGSFALAPVYADPTPVEPGWAAGQFTADELRGHADVYLVEDFERPWWPTRYGWRALRGAASRVQGEASDGFEPLNGAALKVTLRQGERLGLDLRHAFAAHGQPEPLEVYFRYDLRFAHDWNPSGDGGKMPGIAGTYGQAGWGMRKTDGTNGWSLRGGFLRRPNDPSVRGLTALGSYAYHARILDPSGDFWAWHLGPTGVVANGRWHGIEQYVRMNDVGQANGIVRAWVDGRRVFERTDVEFRKREALRIEEVWLNVYHGGTTVAPHDMTLYLDNVVIAKRYIGLLKRPGR